MTRGKKKSAVDRAFDRVRDADPPAGAKERVLRGMQARMERERDPRRRALMIGVPTAIALAAAVAVVLALGPGVGAGDVEVVEVREAFLESRRLRPGDEIDAGRIRVRAGGHVSLAVGEARVRVDDAAELAIREGRLVLRTGAARVRGTLEAEGARCQARVDGEARFEVVQRELQITVLSGTVDTAPPARHCRVIDPEAPAPPESL